MRVTNKYHVVHNQAQIIQSGYLDDADVASKYSIELFDNEGNMNSFIDNLKNVY